MTDYDYSRMKRMKGADIRAAMRAVTLPLAQYKGAKVMPTLEILKRWRLRAKALQKAGWAPAQATGVQYLRNCPPYDVAYDASRKIRRCQRARICPSCFARSVPIEAHRALEHVLIDEDGNRLLDSMELAAAKREWILEAPSARQLGKMLDDIREYRNGERDDCFEGWVGSCTLITIEPHDVLLRLVRSTIAIMPKIARQTRVSEVIEKRDGSLTIRHVQKGTIHKQLLDTVGWAFRYPVGMMYGDAPRTVQLLDAMNERKMRLMKTSGILTNKRQRTLAIKEKKQ
jgi:hypothetical protein